MIHECEIQTSITYIYFIIFPNLYIFLKQTLHWSQQISLCIGKIPLESIGIIHFYKVPTLHVPSFNKVSSTSGVKCFPRFNDMATRPRLQFHKFYRNFGFEFSEVSRGFLPAWVGHPPGFARRNWRFFVVFFESEILKSMIFFCQITISRQMFKANILPVPAGNWKMEPS